MQTKHISGIYFIDKSIYYFMALIFIIFFQVDLCNLWAEEKSGSILSLDKAVDVALTYNSQRHEVNKALPPERIIFFVKKYYYQIQVQTQQLATVEEVRGHFQKAITKSEKIMEEGEGDISQSNITKLKLGLSETLNDIISLNYAIQVTKLDLLELVGKGLKPNFDIAKTDIMPVPFLHVDFDIYLKEKNLSQQLRKIKDKINLAPNRIFFELAKEAKLELHKAFLRSKKENAKVMLGKKNRRITRALLIAEVANYDFGIGDSQELFEALIIYSRVLSGYLDSIYKHNVAVAELEKLTSIAVNKMKNLSR